MARLTDSADAGASPRPTSLGRRFARVGAGLAVAGLVACGALYFARNRVLGPLLVAQASEWLERERGIVLGVDGFEGGWFSELTLRGVSVTSVPGAQEPLHVHVDELRLEHELFRLLRGDLAGLQAVSARGVEARIELGAGSGADSEGETSVPELAGLPPLPSIALERVDLDLRLPQGRAVELRNARATHAGGKLALELPAIKLAGEWPILPREFALVADVAREGERLDVTRLEVQGGAQLKASGGSVRLAAGRVQLETPLEGEGVRGQ
ncbi:MAG: hypothetical protein HUU28_18005, partial [Planctomycetaceae bacterium]|nr:hypothetical protein [Planctomycetaceae bacterium]